MAYEFQTIDLFLFDFHAAFSPLQTGGQVRPGFEFLTDPDAYNQKYRSGEVTPTQDFNVRPMRWRMLTYHHFWKYYQTIHAGPSGPDFWKLQMPLVCHPSHFEVRLVTGSPDYQGEVRAFTFLSALGWSTNFEIRLRGRLTPAQVQEFVSRLPRKGGAYFEVVDPRTSPPAARRFTLPELFDFFSERLRRDVYAPGLVDILKIKRRLILTLSRFTGEINSYRVKLADFRPMPAADRALMHSMLRGAAVSVPDLIALEKDGKFLQTNFSRFSPDFVLTYFDYGALIFMQKAAHENNSGVRQARRGAMRCHSSNVRNYLLMTLALQQFHQDTKKEAASNQVVGSLRDSVRTTLLTIPNRYTNPFCLDFHRSYGPLQKVQDG